LFFVFFGLGFRVWKHRDARALDHRHSPPVSLCLWVVILEWSVRETTLKGKRSGSVPLVLETTGPLSPSHIRITNLKIIFRFQTKINHFECYSPTGEKHANEKRATTGYEHESQQVTSTVADTTGYEQGGRDKR